MKNKYLAPLILGFAVFASASFATTTSYDVLSTANSSSSANLFAAGTSAGSQGGTFSTSSSSLSYTSASDTGGTTYFVATLGAGQPTLSLVNTGDTITLNFTVTGYNINQQSQEIRFGVYNVASDFSATFGPASSFSTEKGYSASYGNTGNNSNGIYQRTGTNTSLFAGVTELNTSGASFALKSAAFGTSGWGGSTGFTTTGSLILTLLENGQVSITSSIGSAGLSGPQTYTSTTAVTSFNAVAFAIAGLNGANGQIDFSDLTLSSTSSIPEPSSSAMILGLAATTCCLVRRSFHQTGR